MIDDAVRALRALGLDAAVDGSELAGSASRSGVHRIVVDGQRAVLKVTAHDDERPNALRELAFYRTLAAGVPVETPALLGSAVTDELVVLLLAEHVRAPPAREWRRDDWLEVAAELATLHAHPPPSGPPWNAEAWLHGVLARPPVDVARAYWSDTYDLVDAPLAAALAAVPSCFAHGDCHVDNLLRDRDSGRLVWTDWQVAGVASPAVDLAFLGHRARTDGADPPLDAMLDTYVERREVERAAMRRALVAAEAGFLLYGFPHHADRRNSEEREHATQRLRVLAKEWHG